MPKKSIKDYTDKELVELAEENHIWLNAMDCINPTDKFKQNIADIVLDKLGCSEMRDEMGISKMIILTINKS